jgi:hypothetical protein
MDSRSPEANVLLRITTALIISVERVIDRLLSFLPMVSKALNALIILVAPAPTLVQEPEPDRAEDIAIR